MAALGVERRRLHRGPGAIGPQTARRLASRHLGRLRRLNPAAPPHRGQDAGQLLVPGPDRGPLPAAEVIHCRRDLRDVAVSCWMTHFREIRWASDQGQIASRFHQYRRMMEHWRKVLPVPFWKWTTRRLSPIWKAWPGASWPGAAWIGSRAAWNFTGRNGRSARPAPSRCASRSTAHRWKDGSTTNGLSFRCSPRWKAPHATGSAAKVRAGSWPGLAAVGTFAAASPLGKRLPAAPLNPTMKRYN